MREDDKGAIARTRLYGSVGPHTDRLDYVGEDEVPGRAERLMKM